MNFQKLKNYIFENNARVKDKPIPVFSVTNTKGFVSSSESFNKIVHSKDISNYKEVKPNFFAYNPSRINVGSIALNFNNSSLAVSPMYTVFECNIEYLLPKYLLYFLKSSNGQNEIKNRTTGTVRFQLKFNQLSNLSIFLPSVSEQQRMVSILEEIDELIKKQKQALELTRQMIPSLFDEMFGDLNNISIISLETISNKITQGPNPKYDKEEDGFYVLKTKDVYNDIIHYDKADKINSLLFTQFKNFELIDGDILIAIVGKGSIGKINIFKEKKNKRYIFTRALGLIRLQKNLILPEYLKYYFFTVKGLNQINNGIEGSSGQLVLKTSYLKGLKLPLPSMQLQCNFVQKANEIQLLQEEQEKSLKNLEQLFESLLNKFFSQK
jgi:restriction endonuclease S subunit